MSKLISLGSTCAVANYLLETKNRTESFPFDWCNINIKQLNYILSTDFIDFDNVKYHKYSKKHHMLDKSNKLNDDEDLGSCIFKNSIGVTFAHELSKKYNISEFKQKLRHRIRRFKNLKHPHFIRYEEKKYKAYYHAELNKLISYLNNYFKSYKLTLLLPNTYKVNIDYTLSLTILEKNIVLNIIYYNQNNYIDWKNIHAFKLLNL